MTSLRTPVTLVVLLACSPMVARADVVLDWNAIAVSMLVSQGQSPFAHRRATPRERVERGRECHAVCHGEIRVQTESAGLGQTSSNLVMG